MVEYKIIIGKSAGRELSKLTIEVIERTQLAVNALATEPRPANCKKLKGFKGLYRIRSGDYRIIYRIEDKELIIEVVKIGDRKDVYSQCKLSTSIAIHSTRSLMGKLIVGS